MMLPKKYYIPAFILLAIIQIYFPVNMIINQEHLLKSGSVYKFKTIPIDPSDPFRGKYIDLRFEMDTYYDTSAIFQAPNGMIFVEIDTDETGFAKIKQVYNVKPGHTSNYIKAHYRKGGLLSKGQRLNITYPFERFYMEESKAQEAEDAYRELSRERDQLTYALIHVKDGKAVISDVYLNEITIKTYLELQRKKGQTEE